MSASSSCNLMTTFLKNEVLPSSILFKKTSIIWCPPLHHRYTDQRHRQDTSVWQLKVLFCRLTNIFPLRRQPFSCADDTISRQTTRSQFIGFAFDSDLPDVIVYSLSFCLPLFIVEYFMVLLLFYYRWKQHVDVDLFTHVLMLCSKEYLISYNFFFNEKQVKIFFKKYWHTTYL